MYKFLKKFLFKLSPEFAHNLALRCLSLAFCGRVISSFCGSVDRDYSINLWGLSFSNIVGLAAGFDKNGEAIFGLSELGFGFIEVGTVTPKPQYGNPKPRLFRLVSDEALINRMGFNNYGVQFLKQKLKQFKSKRPNFIVGVNIGKNKTTPLEEAWQDYVYSFTELIELGDYFVINVSSPNTPNLRQLQDRKYLELIISKLQKVNKLNKPLLIKIAPDLDDFALRELVALAIGLGINGLIVSNTTIRRDFNLRSKFALEPGGLSGRPLKELSDKVLLKVVELSKKRLNIIASGGILDVESALDKLRFGADLIQIYTGFIYRGPCFINGLRRAIFEFYNV